MKKRHIPQRSKDYIDLGPSLEESFKELLCNESEKERISKKKLIKDGARAQGKLVKKQEIKSHWDLQKDLERVSSGGLKYSASAATSSTG